ncbi:MAG: hypothetical protein IJC94_01805 [Oscillospiraceae bacterium]|nr:hypothetical protein [Oscillospiraceae bacterium]
MRKSIFSAAAEKRFRKKARNYLTKTYGDIFSWQAALEIGEQTTHLFSAAANDMSVVCQVHYLRLKKKDITKQQLDELIEAAFCMVFLPAAAEKIMLIPKTGISVAEKLSQAGIQGKVKVIEL